MLHNTDIRGHPGIVIKLLPLGRSAPLHRASRASAHLSCRWL